jgi:hypothetical protein
MGHRDLLEKMEFQGQKVQKANPERRVRLGPLANLVKMARLGQKVHQEKRDRLAKMDLPVLRVLKAKKVLI